MNSFNLSNLNTWIKENDAEKRAFEAFWNNFEYYRNEEQTEFIECFPEYNPSKLELSIKSISITFSNNYPEFDYNYVAITITISYNGKETGHYKFLLNFDGTTLDDSFVIY